MTQSNQAVRRSLGLAFLFAAGLAVSLPVAPAMAADAKGEWARPSGTSRIKMAPCGDAICGTLVWLKDPRNDDKNPDASKRSRPLLGSQTVLGMKPTGKNGQWKGKVYNAEDGETYTGFIQMDGNDKMKLEGCVMGGLLCKGETWTRVK
ncbi:DUF2147 domain-containing protein [Pannonibacter carbonis]|uniref:DUF2147 domain-containing protein n=1 Tax=Pannonibacter carbonis TaxID=2067569 RepID=UPI000D0F3F24|nr:DUF2147 domain-containing protein [Pannonibacter carbonis]